MQAGGGREQLISVPNQINPVFFKPNQTGFIARAIIFHQIEVEQMQNPNRRNLFPPKLHKTEKYNLCFLRSQVSTMKQQIVHTYDTLVIISIQTSDERFL